MLQAPQVSLVPREHPESKVLLEALVLQVRQVLLGLPEQLVLLV